MKNTKSTNRRSFILSVSPFNILSSSEVELLIPSIKEFTFEEDQIIAKEGGEPEFFYLVVYGVVKKRCDRDDILYYYPGDSFDVTSLINNINEHTFDADEKTLCIAIPKDTFLKLMSINSAFEKYYLQDLSQKIHSMINKDVNQELASFMAAKVEDSLIHPAICVSEKTSIYDAVKKMSENHISSILVDCPNCKGGYGIVTDTDLRKKVILENRSYEDDIGNITTNKLISIDKEDFLYNALLLMTEHSVKRLIVKDDNKIVGTLEQIDVLSTISHRSRLFHVRINRATSVEELKTASKESIYMIKALLSQGVKVINITKLLSQLYSQLFRKLFEILAPKDLIDNSCLVVLGSEGRGEQILKTDQDNAIILRDGYRNDNFREIMNAFTNALLECGYPRCKGNIMVSNPYWAKSLREYETEIKNWMVNLKNEDIINIAALYDGIAVAGDKLLLDELKERFLLLRKDKNLLSQFAYPTVYIATPLSFFNKFILDKGHNDMLDIKKGGIFPIVHGIRSFALEANLSETNTFERIEKISEMGIIKKDIADELIEALNFLLTIRLRVRLDKTDKGEKLDNYIDPRVLSKLEQDVLRDILKIVKRFKELVSYHFRLDSLG